jgi:hypothetical protein
MKSFKHFLVESIRTYRYKIKIAGEPDKNWMDLFLYNLNKFDPIKIGEPKRTPIQERPFGFPELKNQSVSIIDAEFKYPCNELMIKQIARLLNYNEDMVRVVQSDADDSWSNEALKYEKQKNSGPLLMHTDDDDSDAKEASKDYADSYLTKIKDQTKSDKTRGITDPFKKQEVKTKSPLSNVSRPPRPKTSASK